MVSRYRKAPSLCFLAGLTLFGQVKRPPAPHPVKGATPLLTEIPVADPTEVTGVELLGLSSSALVYSVRTDLRTVLMGQPLKTAEGARRELMPFSGPEKPVWDVRSLDDGAIQTAFTRPGSALSSIGLATAGQPEAVSVTGHYPFGVFGSPRFVKGDPRRHPAIAAIALDDDGESKVVVLQPHSDGAYGEYRVLETGSAIPQQPTLAQLPSGFALLYKQFAPGAGSARVDGIGSTVTPGPLLLQLLDRGLSPVGGPTQIVQQPVYQFDLAFDASHLVVFATTQKGFVVAVQEAGKPFSSSEYDWARPLFSPSLLIGPDGPHLAALEAPGSPNAKVLAGTAPRR